LTVVENATNRRTIIEHDIQGVGFTRRHNQAPFPLGILRAAFCRTQLQYFALDVAQTTDFATHLHFRVAV
jgi:hypothetical protein